MSPSGVDPTGDAVLWPPRKLDICRPLTLQVVDDDGITSCDLLQQSGLHAANSTPTNIASPSIGILGALGHIVSCDLNHVIVSPSCFNIFPHDLSTLLIVDPTLSVIPTESLLFGGTSDGFSFDPTLSVTSSESLLFGGTSDGFIFVPTLSVTPSESLLVGGTSDGFLFDPTLSVTPSESLLVGGKTDECLTQFAAYYHPTIVSSSVSAHDDCNAMYNHVSESIFGVLSSTKVSIEHDIVKIGGDDANVCPIIVEPSCHIGSSQNVCGTIEHISCLNYLDDLFFAFAHSLTT